jgi:hypothetical protein
LGLAIGIGVNLAGHPDGTEFPAISLPVLGVKAPPPQQALTVLAGHFGHWYEVWTAQGFAPLRDAWLARAAHIRPDGTRDALGVLREELKRQHVRVSRLHAKLFYQPLLESVDPTLGLASGMSAEAAERQLAALGYESPHNALTHLAALVNSSGRRGRVQSVLLP